MWENAKCCKHFKCNLPDNIAYDAILLMTMRFSFIFYHFEVYKVVKLSLTFERNKTNTLENKFANIRKYITLVNRRENFQIISTYHIFF